MSPNDDVSNQATPSSAGDGSPDVGRNFCLEVSTSAAPTHGRWGRGGLTEWKSTPGHPGSNARRGRDLPGLQMSSASSHSSSPWQGGLQPTASEISTWKKTGRKERKRLVCNRKRKMHENGKSNYKKKMRRGYHIKQKKYKTHEKKQKALNQHGIMTVKILSHNLINKRLSTYKVVEEAAPPATPGDDEGEESCKKKEKKNVISEKDSHL